MSHLEADGTLAPLVLGTNLEANYVLVKSCQQ
jgi:hypothetical protein